MVNLVFICGNLNILDYFQRFFGNGRLRVCLPTPLSIAHSCELTDPGWSGYMCKIDNDKHVPTKHFLPLLDGSRVYVFDTSAADINTRVQKNCDWGCNRMRKNSFYLHVRWVYSTHTSWISFDFAIGSPWNEASKCKSHETHLDQISSFWCCWLVWNSALKYLDILSPDNNHHSSQLVTAVKLGSKYKTKGVKSWL